jgi:hypothetical protein
MSIEPSPKSPSQDSAREATFSADESTSAHAHVDQLFAPPEGVQAGTAGRYLVLPGPVTQNAGPCESTKRGRL